MENKVDKTTNSSLSGGPAANTQHVFDTTGGNRGMLGEFVQEPLAAKDQPAQTVNAVLTNFMRSHPPLPASDLLAKDDVVRQDNMQQARNNLCEEVLVDEPEMAEQTLVEASGISSPEFLEIKDVTKIDMITPVTSDHYISLRNVLAAAITAALTSGNAVYERKLFTVDGFGVGTDRRILNFDTWRNTLHPTTQQHYNCNTCRTNWDVIFSICVQKEDGQIFYPAVQALLQAYRAGDPVIENLFRNAPGQAEGFIKYLVEAALPKPNELFPLFNVPVEMNSEYDNAGWEHFHLADRDVLMDYNENRVRFNDIEYVDGLFKRLIDKRFDGEAFTKLCETIRKEVLDKQKDTFSAIDSSALTRHPDLVQFIKEIQLYHKVSQTGLVYLHERLGRSGNGYLRHLNSSVLGNAFDAYFDLLENPNDFDKIMSKVTGVLRRAVDAANYKNKVAEAKPGTVEQAYKFLQDEGLQSTLLRRLIDMDEVRDVKWTMTVLPEPVKAENKPVETLDDAFKAVMGTKDTEEKRLEDVKQKLGLRAEQTSAAKRLSVNAFVESMSGYAKIEMDLEANPRLQPYFATTSIDRETNHSKLLRFLNQFTDHVLHYSTPSQIPSASFASERVNDQLEAIEGSTDPIRVTKVVSITAIMESRDRDEEVMYVANIPGAAATIAYMLRGHGTAIIPATIQADHYGMSKAFQELSANFKMGVKEGCSARNALGGIYIQPGLIFEVTNMDGSKDTVFLSSFK